MAAIVPHLEQEGETTELQERYWACKNRGLAGVDDDLLCPTPQAVVNQSHAGLLDMARMRQILADQMQGRTLSLGYRKDGEVVLTMDKAIRGPAWNPAPHPLQTIRVLGWTSKMHAPSFSLPAGCKQMGGSCPGAQAGQSVVPDKERNIAAKPLLSILKADRVDLAQAICEFCYAEGGQYGTSLVSWGQMMRYIWAQKALSTDLEGRDCSSIEDCAFVKVLIEAINRTDFDLKRQPAHLGKRRFFRIHDSGDFFNVAYLKAWKAIANHFAPKNHDDPIFFWAPTRIWALGQAMVDKVNEINTGPKNLIIRPSAYHINQHGPDELEDHNGWAAPSVVYDHDNQKDADGVDYDWNCKAYETESEKVTCVDSKNAKGKTGCRDCWLRPKSRINYTLHGV